jgi:hypothetical protein
MPKKTARAGSRPAQQRSKEEQWRKRMAAQTRTNPAVTPNGTGGAVSVRDTADAYDDLPEAPAASTSAPATARPRTAAGGAPAATRPRPSPAGAATARSQAASAALQRRANAARPSSARARMGAPTLSIDEEMRYVRGDIRRLIILTAICLAVIIVLSFVVPSIIT